MGNQFKKKEKSNDNTTPEETEEKKLLEKYPNAIHLKDEKSAGKIKLSLLNKHYHSEKTDPIEDILVHPKFTNSIIISTRSGKIKLYTDITSTDNNFNSNEKILFDAQERIFSMIVLKHLNNDICISLANKILILSFNEQNVLEKNLELIDSSKKMKEATLIELANGNIISAGGCIMYWTKNNMEYNNSDYIIEDDIGCRFINIVEFPMLNTVIITQQDTHLIYFIKYDKRNIELIKKIEDVPSIWYRQSAKRVTSNYMIMVGKFELNAIDGTNGEIVNKYPGIDKGSMLNLTQSNSEDDIWILTDFYGNYFEFYIQEGSDFVLLDKIELEENMKISWDNQLARINKECFVAVNHYGGIFVFKAELNNEETKCPV